MLTARSAESSDFTLRTVAPNPPCVYPPTYLRTQLERGNPERAATHRHADGISNQEGQPLARFCKRHAGQWKVVWCCIKLGFGVHSTSNLVSTPRANPGAQRRAPTVFIEAPTWPSRWSLSAAASDQGPRLWDAAVNRKSPSKMSGSFSQAQVARKTQEICSLNVRRTRPSGNTPGSRRAVGLPAGDDEPALL